MKYNANQAKDMIRFEGISMYGGEVEDHEIYWDVLERIYMYLGKYPSAKPEPAQGVFNHSFFQLCSKEQKRRAKGTKPWME